VLVRERSTVQSCPAAPLAVNDLAPPTPDTGTETCTETGGTTPAPATSAGGMDRYQARVDRWLLACFGETIARDRTERNHRFLEEALELVQSGGCTASEAHQLVDYVYGRTVGEMGQEVGGVMNTLAALCLAYGLDMDAEAERELARVWTKIEKIRAKQAAKPKHGPLPGPSDAAALSPGARP
jgi:NTP pyrophosphatase (non-canonical NTP hydrolase)